MVCTFCFHRLYLWYSSGPQSQSTTGPWFISAKAAAIFDHAPTNVQEKCTWAAVLQDAFDQLGQQGLFRVFSCILAHFLSSSFILTPFQSIGRPEHACNETDGVHFTGYKSTLLRYYKCLVVFQGSHDGTNMKCTYEIYMHEMYR
jgi:hypothetical protein